VSGNEGAWRNLGGGYGSDLGLGPICTDWTPLTACPVLVGEPDLLFRIRGVALRVAFVPAVGKIGLLVLMLGVAGVAVRALRRPRVRW
jgi:hypothetical protein